MTNTKYSLIMTFLDDAGEKRNITLNGAREDVSKEEISTAMNAIITNNIFELKGGVTLVSKYAAKLVQTDTSNIEMK